MKKLFLFSSILLLAVLLIVSCSKQSEVSEIKQVVSGVKVQKVDQAWQLSESYESTLEKLNKSMVLEQKVLESVDTCFFGKVEIGKTYFAIKGMNKDGFSQSIFIFEDTFVDDGVNKIPGDEITCINQQCCNVCIVQDNGAGPYCACWSSNIPCVLNSGIERATCKRETTRVK